MRCNTCNLVFHPNTCGLPLYSVPSGDWSCWYCVVDGSVPSNPEEQMEAKKIIELINEMKARVKKAATPLLPKSSQQIVESFKSLIQSADNQETIIIMKQLSSNHIFSKLQSAMNALSISQQPSPPTAETEQTNSPKSLMPPYPLVVDALTSSSIKYRTKKVIEALIYLGDFEQHRLCCIISWRTPK